MVIRVHDVSKSYELYAKPSDMVRELVLGGIRHDVFWALRNVSFEVQPKQRVGIVGANGAGKSTLLKIIAGNLTPTSGTVDVDGKISALLSLVPAWNLNQTGIENIRFNLLLRGSSRAQIAMLTEEIVDFAELGPFISQPVRTYSSGMSARLSFAIATAISPEILIVDEVLGAGDGYFAAKAANRMRDLCDRGKALLFVSHSTSAVQQMCDRVIWMQNGGIRMDGPAEYVLHQYELDYRKAEDETTRAQHRRDAAVLGSEASIDELSDHRRLRFRIVPATGGRFGTTHFVHRVLVRANGLDPLTVPLEGGAHDAIAALDLDSSEWGRLHERGGRLGRILARLHGRRPGGQFTLHIDPQAAETAFEIEIDSEADDPRERLHVQVLDPSTAEWTSLDEIGAATNGSSRFAGKIIHPAADRLPEIRERMRLEALPDVTILGADVIKDSRPATSVKEREDFLIEVRLQFNRRVPLADVGIKLTRADGVYVFWQSSGLVGRNLVDATGPISVRFQFPNHPFGAGEYTVSVTVGNGWDFPANYPYSEVYARDLEACRFRVMPELAALDFGVVNQRASIEIQ
jgi:lipopolysaccharide transport system ATP-binding protein